MLDVGDESIYLGFSGEVHYFDPVSNYVDTLKKNQILIKYHTF